MDTAGSGRNHAIDFLRGVALLAIFCDHLRPNFWNAFTPRGLGFSDFAEVFLFLSGYLNAAVFSKVLAAGGMAALLRRIRARLCLLYSAHLATTALKIGLLYLVAAAGAAYRNPALEAAFDRPWEYLGRALLFLFMPGDLSVLPLYFVLIAASPGILIALRRAPRRTLAASCLLWVLAQFHAFQPGAMAEETAWYFHPLAWQLLFIAGAALRMHPRVARLPVLSRPLILSLATAVLILVAALKLAYRFAPELFYASLGKFHILLADDFRKSTLSPLRAGYFACLLLAAAPRVLRGHRSLSTPLPRWVSACGKHSLLVFCCTIPAGMMGNVALAALRPSPLLELAIILAGSVTLVAIAQAAEARARWLKRARQPAEDLRREETVPAPLGP